MMASSHAKPSLRWAAVVLGLAVGGALVGTAGLIGLPVALVTISAALGLLDIRDAMRGVGASRRSFWLGLLLPLGLLTLFAAERIIGSAHEQVGWWRTVALASVGAAIAWRVHQLVTSAGAQRQVERRLLAACGGVLAALGLYALSTEGGLELLGLEGPAAERTEGSLSALWPAVFVVSYGAYFFMQLAYRGMPVEEAIELRRIRAAMETGLTLALSLVFVLSMLYVAEERDVRRDLSYFRTTEASETSLRMVGDLDEPIEVVLFYPSVNEVLDQLRPYFDQLEAGSDRLVVTVRDHALAPELARRHEVRGNGTVLLLRGEGEGQRGEKFQIGTELEAARRQLRRLDGTFQQHFARLTTLPRALHVTAGHQERSASGATGDPEDQRLSNLNDALTRSNIQNRELGVAQGLANEVPEDARAVAVIGPRQPFLPEEAQALLRYVQRGGRLVVFVDPDVDHGLAPLLGGLGVGLRDGVLHSERNYIRRLPPPAAREVVFTNTYSAHPTVTLANRNRRYVASILRRAGALERRESEAELAGLSVTFPMRAEEGFWLDLDGDHEQDEDEPTGPRFYAMAAVTVANEGGDEGRAVVVSDGDFITDGLVANRGNAFVLMDVLNWLVGEDRILGPQETEEDVAIQHSRDEDKAWFYGTSFGAPFPLLLIGAWLAMRRFGGARRKPKSAKEADPSAEPTSDASPETLGGATADEAVEEEE